MSKNVLPLLSELHRRGARQVARLGRELDISPKHPSWDAAREAVLNELTIAAVILQGRADAKARDEAEQALAKQAKLDAENKATIAKWKKAGTNAVDALPALGIGQAVGRDEYGNVSRVETGGKLKALLGLTTKAALAVNEGYAVLSVAEADAEAFAMRYSLPTTLQWSSEGRVCWAFSETGYSRLGMFAGCLAGNRIQVAACRHGGASAMVYAPIHKSRFIVAPKDALPKNASDLPAMPEQLVRLFNIVCDKDALTLDKALLG